MPLRGQLQVKQKVEYRPPGAGLQQWRRGVIVAIIARRIQVKPAWPKGAAPVELAPRHVRPLVVALRPLSERPASTPVQLAETGAVVDATFCQEPVVVSLAQRSRPVHKPAAPFECVVYRRFVAGLPCCSCGAAAPSEVHHYGPRGVGEKTDDTRTVPLCRRCHDAWHHTGALPGRDQVESRHFFVLVQVDLLTLFLRGRM